MAKLTTAYDRLMPRNKDGIDYTRINRMVLIESHRNKCFNQKPRLVKKTDGKS